MPQRLCFSGKHVSFLAGLFSSYGLVSAVEEGLVNSDIKFNNARQSLLESFSCSI